MRIRDFGATMLDAERRNLLSCGDFFVEAGGRGVTEILGRILTSVSCATKETIIMDYSAYDNSTSIY